MENPELILFRNTARRLLPLLDELVFCGGCATAQMFSEVGFIRPTPPQWLDVIAKTQGDMGWGGLTVKLKEMSLREDTIGRGRWKLGALTLCFWNVDPLYNPFASRFISDAYAMPRKVMAAPDLKVKLVNPAMFLALKLEAFHGRGGNDFQHSDDLNDLIAILAGRAEVAFDLRLAAPQVKTFIQRNLAEYKSKRDFQEAIKRVLNNDEARIATTLTRLNEIVRIDLK